MPVVRGNVSVFLSSLTRQNLPVFSMLILCQITSYIIELEMFLLLFLLVCLFLFVRFWLISITCSYKTLASLLILFCYQDISRTERNYQSQGSNPRPSDLKSGILSTVLCRFSENKW